MLYSKIKAFHRTCRKVAKQSPAAKQRAKCLTTLIGEIDSFVKGKDLEITDELILEIIRKFIKNIDLTISKIQYKQTPLKLILEKECLESFLPPKLTDVELEVIIKFIIATAEEPVTLGLVMKSLNADYKGLYDGGIAKVIIMREL